MVVSEEKRDMPFFAVSLFERKKCNKNLKKWQALFFFPLSNREQVYHVFRACEALTGNFLNRIPSHKNHHVLSGHQSEHLLSSLIATVAVFRFMTPENCEESFFFNSHFETYMVLSSREWHHVKDAQGTKIKGTTYVVNRELWSTCIIQKNSSAKVKSHSMVQFNVETGGKDTFSEAGFVMELSDALDSINNIQDAEDS